ERVGSLQQPARRVFERAGADAVVALAVVVPLSVRATPQTGLGEDLVFDFPLLLQLDLGLEDVDLAAPLGRDAIAQLFFPGRGHGNIPRASQPAPRCVRASRGGALTGQKRILLPSWAVKALQYGCADAAPRAGA